MSNSSAKEGLNRGDPLLSLQRALLGEVTPEMRSIDIRWTDDEIWLRIVLDSEPNKNFDEIVNGIEGEVQGDFLPIPKISTEVTVSPVGSHRFLEHGTPNYAIAFARSE